MASTITINSNPSTSKQQQQQTYTYQTPQQQQQRRPNSSNGCMCVKFVPQAFNTNKCQQCFNLKDIHSAEALAEFSKVILISYKSLSKKKDKNLPKNRKLNAFFFTVSSR